MNPSEGNIPSPPTALGKPHVHIGGNRLFLQVGGGRTSKIRDRGGGSRFHPHQYHIQIWDPRILFSI